MHEVGWGGPSEDAMAPSAEVDVTEPLADEHGYTRGNGVRSEDRKAAVS